MKRVLQPHMRYGLLFLKAQKTEIEVNQKNAVAEEGSNGLIELMDKLGDLRYIRDNWASDGNGKR